MAVKRELAHHYFLLLKLSSKSSDSNASCSDVLKAFYACFKMENIDVLSQVHTASGATVFSATETDVRKFFLRKHVDWPLYSNVRVPSGPAV